MFRKYTLALGLTLILVVQGCATVPSYRETANAQLMIKKFFTDLQNQNYEDSYVYFSDDLKRTITLTQHVGIMQLLHNELGNIKDYKKLPHNLPLPVFLDEGMFRDPFRDDGSIIWLYELQYEKEPVETRIEVKRENGQYFIETFVYLSDRIYNDARIRDKIKAMGVPIAEE